MFVKELCSVSQTLHDALTTKFPAVRLPAHVRASIGEGGNE